MTHKRIDLKCSECGAVEKNRHHLAKKCLSCSSRGYKETKNKPALEIKS